MTIRTVLWAQPRKDGTAAVKIYVNLKGVVHYFKVDSIYIEPEYWDKAKQAVKAKHPSAKLYNAKIRARKLEVEEHFLNGGTFQDFGKTKAENKLVTEALEEYIDLNQEEYSPKTIKLYHCTINRIKQFDNEYSITSKIGSIDANWADDFVRYMKSMGYKKSAASLHLSRVRNAAKQQRVDNPHIEKVRCSQNKTAPKTYLTPDEIALMENVPASELGETLDTVRDFFLLAYYFLLRNSDLSAISRSNFMEKNGKMFYVGRNKKTKTQVIVPVKQKAKEILEKHNYDCSAYSNGWRNSKIREVAEIAGINALVEQNNELVPKYQVISMHTARRSAATNLDMQGMSQHGIKMLGGWKNISSLSVYFRSGNMDVAEKAEQFEHFK
ncbi:tyrosine-type recombinase/integrase [Phaeodactylibacter xiamenensis]|uniref:tyrosine-type recombinase/integrase n=1 Tax=Phaeodactylibacter xiamenensis TaxID=1524460 RepID=UPI003CCC0E2B